MTPFELLKKMDDAGAVLTIAAGKLGYQIPKDATALLPEIHRLRHEVADILQGRLASNLRCWRRAQGVACPIGSSNPAILHREFGRWSGYRCAREEFIAAIAKLGFPLDANGMITGLVLLEDFAAACEYESVVDDERRRARAVTEKTEEPYDVDELARRQPVRFVPGSRNALRVPIQTPARGVPGHAAAASPR